MKLRTLTCTTAMTLFVALGLAASARAQTFTLLHSFDVTDGYYPRANLVQATSGNLYGTTPGGVGTIYSISPSGTLTTLYSFCQQSGCTDGSSPFASLIQAAGGDLYGTTSYGGANSCAGSGCGTVFKITLSGTLTTLHSFDVTDGEFSHALVQSADGNFYGTTLLGGANDDGTVFKMTPNGTLTTLHSFDKTDGQYPVAPLIQATNGSLYGTTEYGGANGYGTVFKITSAGTLTTLYNFCPQRGCTDGEYPSTALVQATDGNFYGTAGGGNGNYGTIFKITPSGTLTTLYKFCSQSGCTDGDGPSAALVQATDGNFYGTTNYGGTNDYGTIFEISPGDTLTTLYSFDGTTNTDPSPSALVQDTNGNFYGTTERGGTDNAGTVFSLSVGLGPFVETLTRSGKVGASVKILGTNLTGATSVTFNGTPATFTVGSANGITTTVPAGATTGTVVVVTPGGTLSSNVPFRVTQ